MIKLLKERSSWLVLVALGLWAIFSIAYFGTRSDETQTAHHEEVKGLIREAITIDKGTEVKVDKLDKKVDKVTYDMHVGQALYLKDLSLINKTLKNNQASYDKTYALMDTTDVAAVNSFNAKWLSKADSLDEW